MLAVGVVSVRVGGAAIWRVPAAFVCAMALGGMVGVKGWPVPLAEAGIAWSVLLLGLAVAWGPMGRWRQTVFAAVLVFGFFHGYAHGLELPRSAEPLFYSMGFLIASLFLHVCGIFVGELGSQAGWRDAVLRGAGVLMAGAGVWWLLRSAA